MKYSILGIQMMDSHEYDLIARCNRNEERDGIKPTKRQVSIADKIYRRDNPRNHVLYDVPVTLPEYQRWSFIFDNEYQATGIEPTHTMAEWLINKSRFPSEQDIKDMEKFDKEMDKSYLLNKR